MGADCNDCSKLAVLEKRTDIIDEGLKGVISSINNLEKSTAVDRERISNFTTSIIKIEKGVEDIRKSMEASAKRPLDVWDKVISAVAGGAIIFILTEVLPYFFGN